MRAMKKEGTGFKKRKRTAGKGNNRCDRLVRKLGKKTHVKGEVPYCGGGVLLKVVLRMNESGNTVKKIETWTENS